MRASLSTHFGKEQRASEATLRQALQDAKNEAAAAAAEAKKAAGAVKQLDGDLNSEKREHANRVADQKAEIARLKEQLQSINAEARRLELTESVKKKLQELQLGASVEPAQALLSEMRTAIVDRLCAGVPSRAVPLHAPRLFRRLQSRECLAQLRLEVRNSACPPASRRCGRARSRRS